MAKKPVQKVDKPAALKESQTLARKRARLAKHMKKHPNDAQSQRGLVGSSRKKPLGMACPPAKWNLKDDAGHAIEQPAFMPKYLAV